ncbi:hypothetical protein WOLCODRAFT_160091 [Wolfiporia cocos MD-104 SS10]|uniref:MYND-type domain-containing protein n=1 Tax=Wolfiporia cocos (strain MD-104) TaxID=742152 RepID=A0A2H3IU30_WOLCO|nr:hypothetical protein WOLCODRAFT_160091 [Wolfiporia cocos MD-104 SS10]
MSAKPLPSDFVLDLHDLASIVLHCHARFEDRFVNTQLVEVNNGTTRLQSLPPHILPQQWDIAGAINKQRRIAYILRKDPSLSERVEVNTFAHPEGVKLPPSFKLGTRELEDILWRCKTFDSGYLLAYVAQSVFERLPGTARLHARTSSGHEIFCAPSDVMVAEFEILPHETCCMVAYKPRPDLGPTRVDLEQHLSGMGNIVPWIYLMIGKPISEDLDTDTRVVFDLAITQIGGRGAGGELFALERGFDYHNKLLCRYAEEQGDLQVSGKLMMSPVALRKQGDTLTDMVMERLQKLASGNVDFCRYCGKDDISTRCTKCKKAWFCRDCQAPGWKYHKVWCRPSVQE